METRVGAPKRIGGILPEDRLVKENGGNRKFTGFQRREGAKEGEELRLKARDGGERRNGCSAAP